MANHLQMENKPAVLHLNIQGILSVTAKKYKPKQGWKAGNGGILEEHIG